MVAVIEIFSAYNISKTVRAEWEYKVIYFMQVSKKGLREGLQKNQWESVEYVFTSHILEIPTDFFLVPRACPFLGFP